LAFALPYDMAIRSNGFSSSSVPHCSPNHACDAVIRLAICRRRGCPPMKTRLEGIDVLCGVAAPWSERLVAAARHRSDAIAIVMVGCVIAAIAPFDTAFAYLSNGSALARVCLFAVIGTCGVFCAEKSGLQLRPSGLRCPTLTPIRIALLVAVYVIVIDCVVFRTIVPQSTIELFRNVPLGPRLLGFMMRAWNENIIYRLTVMSGLSWLIGFLWRSDGVRPAAGPLILAAIIAQVINISMNVSEPSSPMLLVYDVVRYIPPGVLWGYLYWRNGFATAEIASVGTHPFLQPFFGVLIS
jgi:hypothetical protein